MKGEGLCYFYQSLSESFPLVAMMGPFEGRDWENHCRLTKCALHRPPPPPRRRAAPRAAAMQQQDHSTEDSFSQCFLCMQHL
eukprot:SAG11_NODE_1814_length_4218_cov_2.964797_3_plen_82_part_00